MHSHGAQAEWNWPACAQGLCGERLGVRAREQEADIVCSNLERRLRESRTFPSTFSCCVATVWEGKLQAACEGLREAVLVKVAMEVSKMGSVEIELLMGSSAAWLLCHQREE